MGLIPGIRPREVRRRAIRDWPLVGGPSGTEQIIGRLVRAGRSTAVAAQTGMRRAGCRVGIGRVGMGRVKEPRRSAVGGHRARRATRPGWRRPARSGSRRRR
jgi:hypothetical protein